MTQEELIKRLREYIPKSKYASKIQHLYLFGSYARNEQDKKSDVDLMADFMPGQVINYFDMVDFEDELKKLLKVKKIDFGTRKYLSPHIKDRVEKELIQIL